MPSSPISSSGSSEDFCFFSHQPSYDNGLPPDEITFNGVLYNQRQEIGKGGSASVWSYESPNGKILATKVFRNHNDLQGKFEYEYEIMNQLESLIGDHDHIIRYFGSTTIRREGFAPLDMLIFEYCPSSLANEVTPIPEARAWTLIRGVLEGLAEIHRQGFMHRDVKPENLLFRENGDIVLADFGEAARLDTSNWYCGTLNYMAPELRQGHNYTNKVDIWALGCCILSLYGCAPFVDLLRGMDPWQASRFVLTEEHIEKVICSVQQRMPKTVQTLVELCLKINPEVRASAEELLGEMEFMDCMAVPNMDNMDFDESEDFNELEGVCFIPQTIAILPPSATR